MEETKEISKILISEEVLNRALGNGVVQRGAVPKLAEPEDEFRFIEENHSVDGGATARDVEAKPAMSYEEMVANDPTFARLAEEEPTLPDPLDTPQITGQFGARGEKNV